MLPLLHPFRSHYRPEMQTDPSKKNIWREWYHIGIPTLIGDFNRLRGFFDSQIIALHIPIALYHATRYGVIGEEQHQINNPSKPFIIRRK